MPVRARDMQRGVVPDSRDGVQIRARIDQHRGNLDEAPLCRPVQRRHPVGVRSLYVGPMTEQVAYGGFIATPGRVGDQ